MIFQCSCHLFLLNVKMCFVWEDLFFVHWCWSYPHFEVKIIDVLIHWTSNWIIKCFDEQIIKGWIESCVVHLEIDFIFVFLYFKQNLMRNQHLLVLISLLIAVEGASIHIWHLILDFLLILSNLVCGRYSDNCGTFKTQGMAFICHPIYNILKYE